MSTNLILDFPILKKDSVDFFEEVSYEVAAHKIGGQLKVTHVIKGRSFISELVKINDAVFSVLLLYKDSGERQEHVCNADEISINGDEITATQTISMEFSYAPEITPSIVILKNKTIMVNESSGLTDFWKQGDHFHIPQYSRIALGYKLKFTSGDLSKLIRAVYKKELDDGEVEVVVRESAGEGETPVDVFCGKGVYDELHKVTIAKPRDSVESMRSAIITQVLCAIYAYMQNLNKENDGYEIGGVLAAHLERLESDTGQSWESENFNPSLAATKMQPYAVKVLVSSGDDDD